MVQYVDYYISAPCCSFPGLFLSFKLHHGFQTLLVFLSFSHSFCPFFFVSCIPLPARLQPAFCIQPIQWASLALLCVACDFTAYSLFSWLLFFSSGSILTIGPFVAQRRPAFPCSPVCLRCWLLHCLHDPWLFFFKALYFSQPLSLSLSWFYIFLVVISVRLRSLSPSLSPPPILLTNPHVKR